MIATAVWGLAAWAVLVPQQHRLIRISPGDSALTVGLNAAALYLAVALSGLTGALGVALVGAHRLSLVGVVLLLAGLLSAEAAHRLIARRR